MSKKILLVDDDDSILMSLEFLLKKNGFEYRVAKDGEEAIMLANEFMPNLILLDVMMPKINGYDVCSTLKSDPKFNETKIFLLTAKGRDIEQVKGLSMGADAYITKPFSTRDLIIKINETI